MKKWSWQNGWMLVFATAIVACVQIPIGRPRLKEIEDTQILEEPIVYVGSVSEHSDVTRSYILEEAAGQVALKASQDLRSIPARTSDAETEARLRRISEQGEVSYRREVNALPPHYLVRYEVALDGTELPSVAQVVDVARGHVLWRLLLSWLPVHRVEVAIRCDVSLYQIEGAGVQKRLGRRSYESARTHFGNFWWLTSAWEGTVKNSFRDLTGRCLDAIRRYSFHEIAEFHPEHRSAKTFSN